MSAAGQAGAVSLLHAVQAKGPRVHCLTNHVARAFTANVLLAVGALPSMSADESEVGAFVSGADALLVNLGTLDAAMRTSIEIAVDVAISRGLPIVVDPVFADRSQPRAEFARELIRRVPAAIRCNAAEAEALGAAVLDHAKQAGTIVALTGAVDSIEGDGRTITLTGGDPLMTRVTAMGCALGAVIAACLATGENRFDAVAEACRAFKDAGAEAGASTAGPGTFVPAFLDSIYAAAHDGAPREGEVR